MEPECLMLWPIYHWETFHSHGCGDFGWLVFFKFGGAFHFKVIKVQFNEMIHGFFGDKSRKWPTWNYQIIIAYCIKTIQLLNPFFDSSDSYYVELHNIKKTYNCDIFPECYNDFNKLTCFILMHFLCIVQVDLKQKYYSSSNDSLLTKTEPALRFYKDFYIFLRIYCLYLWLCSQSCFYGMIDKCFPHRWKWADGCGGLWQDGEKKERLSGRCQEKNNRIHSLSSVSVRLSVFLVVYNVLKQSRLAYFSTQHHMFWGWLLICQRCLSCFTAHIWTPLDVKEPKIFHRHHA